MDSEQGLSAALLPCPFCGARLELSEAFSNRTRSVFVHPSQADEEYPCPTLNFRVASNDAVRVARWNIRSEARPVTDGGFVLVPREPTGEMVSAGCRVDTETDAIKGIADVYRAMIAASPVQGEDHSALPPTRTERTGPPSPVIVGGSEVKDPEPNPNREEGT